MSFFAFITNTQIILQTIAVKMSLQNIHFCLPKESHIFIGVNGLMFILKIYSA